MPAHLKALVLCDFAQVREGLLFVQSGGLTRLGSNAFPAHFGCHLAMLVYSPPDEIDVAHTMEIRVKAATTASVVATVNVAMHEQQPTGLGPGEGRLLPVVVPLGAVAFPEPGEYDLQVDLDDELAGDLTFQVIGRSS